MNSGLPRYWIFPNFKRTGRTLAIQKVFKLFVVEFYETARHLAIDTDARTGTETERGAETGRYGDHYRRLILRSTSQRDAAKGCGTVICILIGPIASPGIYVYS